MSTYTDLHTRVIKENIAILRKPSQEDDGLTMQRVVFANKDNVYFGTFKGPLELSDSTMTNTTINGGKLNGTDITEGIVKYDNGDIKASEIANNQLADEAQLSALQEDMRSISAAHDALSTGLSTAISALDIYVNERIDEVSADLSCVSADLCILSAKAKEISGTVSSMSAQFIDAINTAKDDAVASARVYTDESIEELSNTVGFKYEDQHLYLSANGKTCEVNCSAFIKDGMLDKARYDAVGDDTHVNPPYLVLTFNTDAGKDDIWVSVKDLVNIYEASNDGIELSGNKFCLKYADIKDKTGLDSLCADLFGTAGAQPKQGIIPEIKEQISAISVDNFQVMSFAGHFIDNDPYYDSISAFFEAQHGPDYEPRNAVKNDSAFNIVTEDISTIIVNGDNVLSLGNGDVLVVHDHSNARYVDVSCLSYGSNISDNVYLLKAGVSRYEFEAERAQRTTDDNFISAWIKQNFANTDSNSSSLTTTLKQDVSASSNVSVNNDAYVFGKLNASSLTASSMSAELSDFMYSNGLCSMQDLADELALRAVEVEYTELVQLRDTSSLVPGMKYRITDFVTAVDQEGCRSAGHPFDLVVVAMSNNQLDEKATATLPSNGDGYFDARPYHMPAYQSYIEYKRVPLESWELKYCLDNDKTRFQWADEANGKGVIWQMKDEFGNEAPYDFKNVQFKRYLVTDCDVSSFNGTYGLSADKAAVDANDFKWCYTFNGIDYADKGLNEPYDFSGLHVSPTDAVVSQFPGAHVRRLNCCVQNIVHEMYEDEDGSSLLMNTLRLPNNVFQCKLNIAIDGVPSPLSELLQIGYCVMNTLGANSHSNTFNDNCNNNALGYYCICNMFGSSCDHNIFSNTCRSNMLGIDCNRNAFSNDCNSNALDDGCSRNVFGNSCDGNVLGNDCSHNAFGNDCDSNTVGDNSTDNTFGNYNASNVLGNGCVSNAFKNSCKNNIFSNDCDSNAFANNCLNNRFGNSTCRNAFGNNCVNNVLGSSCVNNFFGNDCKNNHFGNTCNDNVFSNYCDSNSFGNNCINNVFKNSCKNNIVGNVCNGNTFGNYCSYIVFGSSSDVTSATAKSYCRYINIASGNQYIILNATHETSNSSYYQNVDIKPGVNNYTVFKTIADDKVNQSFATTYQPADSQVIAV